MSVFILMVPLVNDSPFSCCRSPSALGTGLLFSPCLINCLLNFIKTTINSVKLMVLWSSYSNLPQNDESMI